MLRELLSDIRPYVGIAGNTLSSGNTIYTASVSPQPAAGIDTWQAGKTLFRNLLICTNVTALTAGSLEISLYDSLNPITTANVASAPYKAADLAPITAVGFYVAELIFEHVFDASLARCIADADNENIRRYHSIKAVATGGNATFDVICLYGQNRRNFPTQPTKLATTWVAA